VVNVIVGRRHNGPLLSTRDDDDHDDDIILTSLKRMPAEKRNVEK